MPVLGGGAGAGAVSWLYTRNIIRCRRLSVLCLLALCGIYPLQVLFWPTAVSRAVLFARILLYVQCSRSTNHCFSMFQHATHTIVVLDIAWPWASEAYGLCRLCHLRAYFCARKLARARSYWPCRSTDPCFKRATKSTVALDTAWPCANDTYGLCCFAAYFCAHKLNLFRARSYVVIPCCARGGDRVPVLGAVAGCWVCVVGAGAGCCQLAVRVVETGCRVLAVRVWCCELACRCWVLVYAAGLLVLVVCVCGADWVLVPGAGAGCARSGDTPRCIACKNWSCCQCRVQPKNIFCMLLLSGVYAGVILMEL